MGSTARSLHQVERREMHSDEDSTSTPDLRELSDLIKELTEAYSRTMIVVDALDESGMDERAEIVNELKYITDESTSLVKVFVTSREEPGLRLHLQSYPGIQVTCLDNVSDIVRFVNTETDRLVTENQLLADIEGREREQLKVLIKEDVVSKADGVFRWAQLKLQSLGWIRTERDIRNALSETPRPLSDLYEQLYQNALTDTRGTAVAVFQNTLRWMLCATWVLVWKDFSRAITSFVNIEASEISEDDISNLLAGFVVFDTTEEGSHTFRFAHLSVREFLETKPEYCSEVSNRFTAEVCLLQLVRANFARD
ncbi:hypothetical protein ABOM_007320 [Aspergillus bombycis]|uniref:Nephrocystin 3-like N-terminal domain-containing protein n=1 Tax=Aspergillus bombycis TaxID=109264 RepID=A0A1F7ZX80_9EURO|nr:hypothetical protein ABOM_007320 [Aspergillus bombycis]OGM44091.1 hypothetical protein ABOM_007320 [Aspergillus bombycis]